MAERQGVILREKGVMEYGKRRQLSKRMCHCPPDPREKEKWRRERKREGTDEEDRDGSQKKGLGERRKW